MKTYAELERSLSASSPMVHVRDTLAEVARRFRTAEDEDPGPGPQGSTRPYSQHPLVYSCVKAIANNVAQCPFGLLDPNSNEPLSQDDPLAMLFSQPNGMMSFYDLLVATEVYLNLGGMCLWVPVPSLDGKNIIEFWPFSKKQFKADIRGNVFFGWEVNWKGFKDKFEPSEVIYFRYFNPDHPINGMAPLEAARLAIDQDWWANKYNESFFRNGAELGVVLHTERSLTPEQVIQVRETFEQRHRGFSNARRAMVIGGGFEVHELGMTKRDMQYIEQMRWSRDQIMTVFRVPPAELMIFEMVSSRVEGAGAQRRAFGEEVIAPELMMIEGKINNWLAHQGFNAEGHFDTSEVSILQDSRAELIAQAKTLADIGFPINAINEKLGLGFEKIPWGDEWFIQSGMLPASLLVDGPADSTPATKGLKNRRRILLTEEDVKEIVASYRQPVIQLQTAKQERGQEDAGTEKETEVSTAIQAAEEPPRYSDEELRRGKKVQRWLFDLRNALLRQADGIGTVCWSDEAKKLSRITPVSSHEFTLEIKSAIEGIDKQQIKDLFSALKSQAFAFARKTVVEEEEANQPPRFEFEEIDREAAWREAMSFITPIERKYSRRLYDFFSTFEKEYIEAFRNQMSAIGPQETRTAGEPDIDYEAADERLLSVSKSSIEEAVLVGGKCSRLIPSRRTRAKTTHVPMSREVRVRAQQAQDEIAALANGNSTPNNHPIDVISGKNAVEVKALVSQGNDKITMHPESLARKVEFVKKNRMRGSTVAVDLRGSVPVYYYHKGFGSFRLSSMEQITADDLAKLIGGS